MLRSAPLFLRVLLVLVLGGLGGLAPAWALQPTQLAQQVASVLKGLDPWMPLLWLLFTALGIARAVQLHGRFRAQRGARQALGLSNPSAESAQSVLVSLAWMWAGVGALALVLLGLVIALEGGPGHAQLVQWDAALDHAARQWVAPQHLQPLHLLTDSGDVAFMALLTVLAAVWLARKKRWLDLQIWLFFSLFNGMLIRVLKLTFDRARPSNLHDLVVSGASFPSGHTAGSVLIYVLLAHLLAVQQTPRVRALWVAAAALWALGIGVSRVLLSAHWASDVVAGLALGGMSVLGAMAVQGQLRHAQG